MKQLKIGVLREEKSPPDKRVPLTPLICSEINRKYPNVELVVQPSDIRCYTNQEYTSFGITLQEDLRDCDVLMGVKEVPIEKLIPHKKYFFFSHTIKKQAHNQNLMKALIAKKIEMIDYETLADKMHNRIIGFGRYAGIVGAYNGILGYGLKYDLFRIKPANLCRDKDEMEEMRVWLKRNTVGIHPLFGIGSGGNINKIYKMSGKKETKHLSYERLKGIYDMLCSYTYQERIERLDLKPDRADVIIPAAKIFLTVMKNANIERVFVPQVGLSDGIVHQMYEGYISKQKVKS
jgi:hypothetical protein